MEAVVVVGRRRWCVSGLGVLVALLGVLARRTDRRFESWWVADSDDHGIDTVLVVGIGAAWFTSEGVGFADQGPDPAGGLGILIVSIVLTLVLAACGLVCFRFDHARRLTASRGRKVERPGFHLPPTTTRSDG